MSRFGRTRNIAGTARPRLVRRTHLRFGRRGASTGAYVRRPLSPLLAATTRCVPRSADRRAHARCGRPESANASTPRVGPDRASEVLYPAYIRTCQLNPALHELRPRGAGLATLVTGGAYPPLIGVVPRSGRHCARHGLLISARRCHRSRAGQFRGTPVYTFGHESLRRATGAPRLAEPARLAAQWVAYARQRPRL